MALFDFKKLTDSIQEAAGTVANAALGAAGAVASVSQETAGAVANAAQGAAGTIANASQEAAGAVANVAQETMGSVTSAAQNLNIPDALSAIPDSITGAVEGLTHPNNNGGKGQPAAPGTISSTDSMRIFYYLMSADGALTSEELARYDGLWDELGLSKEGSAELIRSCESELTAHASSIPLVSAMAATDAVLYAPSPIGADEQPITAKLLVWNMFAIAYADESIDDGERELIEHVARHMEVSDAHLKEMESAVLTLKDLEREEVWVKTTDRSYLTIEKNVKEIELRAQDVLVGAEALIAL